MAAEIPQCRNFREGRECSRSDVRAKGETDQAWIFRCASCGLVQVVSKDGIRDKSKFDNARKREEEEKIRRKILDSKKLYFT